MSNINNTTYTGYLWKSDEKMPETYDEKVIDLNFDDNKNPFIIEGWLTNGKESISIKYIDGKHLIKKFDLEALDIEAPKVDIHTFKCSFKSDYSDMVFKQYWGAEEDKLCEGMKVLQPAEFVFIGFKNRRK